MGRVSPMNDILIWVGLESMEMLGNLLHTRIGIIEGVQNTQTFVNLSIKKHTHGLVL